MCSIATQKQLDHDQTTPLYRPLVYPSCLIFVLLHVATVLETINFTSGLERTFETRKGLSDVLPSLPLAHVMRLATRSPVIHTYSHDECLPKKRVPEWA